MNGRKSIPISRIDVSENVFEMELEGLRMVAFDIPDVKMAGIVLGQGAKLVLKCSDGRAVLEVKR